MEAHTQAPRSSNSTAAQSRAKTRFRVYATAVVVALAGVGGVFLWWLWSPGELPDLGDPFDLARARQPIVIPDGDNAYAAYAEARIKLEDMPELIGDAAWAANEDALRWSKVDLGVRERLEQDRAALEIWREGSERPDALFHQPGDYSVDTLLGLMQEVYFHNALAARRRLAAGGAREDGRGVGLVPGDVAFEPNGGEACRSGRAAVRR